MKFENFADGLHQAFESKRFVKKRRMRIQRGVQENMIILLTRHQYDLNFRS